MRNQVFKKLFSVLLALIMVAGLLPASVLAEGEGNADSTPAPTEAVQPTESAEPTTPTETETPEVTEIPEPTPENPAATVEPTQGEPTAKPTDEGIMPANVMPVQANVELQYRIVHLDCGRKYFSKDWIIALINEMAKAGYNQLQLAFGNGGFRFYLDDMAVGSYQHEQVKNALEVGNNYYNENGDHSPWTKYNPLQNALTQTEMTAIIKHAQSKGIEIVPMLNTPGHMHAVLAAMGELGITGTLKVSEGCLNLDNDAAVSFTKELVSKYVKFFADQGCNFFNAAMDEYSQWADALYTYANDIISIIAGQKMTPRMFNDAFRANSKSNTISTNDVQVCYWFYGNNCYPVDYITQYQLINANHDYYYVSTDEDWNLYSEGYTFVGEYNEDKWVNKAKQFNNNTFNHGKGFGKTVNDPVGSMFCIWCNTPGKNDETQIAQQIRMILRVIGARMKNSYIYSTSDVLVEGGFKADGTINVPTNNKTVGNGSGNTTADNDTVRVTGPNLAALKCETTTVTIQGAAEGKIAAYDVTPSTADSKYTEKAEVRIKIPAEWDKTKVKAFIVEDGTAKDIDGTATEDGWYVFTAPHFSVMGIYEKAAEYLDGGTHDVPKGGELKLDRIEGENLAGEYHTADSSIATVEVTGEDEKTGSGFDYISENVNYPKYCTSSTRTKLEGYYFKYNNTYYEVYVRTYTQYWTTYYECTYFRNNNYTRINRTTDASTTVSLYKRVSNTQPAYTDITFKGHEIGTTTVVIGRKKYTINVIDPVLAQQVLPINLWITNTGVVPTGWGTSYNSVTREGFTYGLDATTGSGTWNTFRAIYELKATEGNINSEQGAKLSELIPNTGKAYGYRGSNTPEEYNVDIWKCSYNASAERQSTDGWTNSSNKGTEFEYIRYWDNKWEYCSAKTGEWTEVGEVGAGKDDSGKNQVCVWYRQVTTVTSEVTTEIVDWGPIKYAANQCLLDFAVKYDGTANRIPNSFPVTGKTIGFDCPTNQPVPLGNGYVVQDTDGTYYRTVYGIAGVETAEYEVYMITVTPTSDTHTDYITKGTKPTESNGYPYGGTEKIAWAKTEADANSTELNKMPNVKYGGEPFLESVKIYQYQGLLVTYYLRAKETTDSLTVHYAIDGTNVEFHKYNIIVKANADGTYPTFDENIGLNKTNPKGPLDNGTIVNSTDVTITVSSDLSTLNNLEPQYRYSDYDVKRSWREDDKNVWIYYTFKREHTYVIDFGLPLKIKFSDFGVTNDEAIGTVSLWEKETVLENKGLYGTAKVIMNDTEGKYVLYTLDKPLDKNITIPLYVKFSQKGDNDKPQLFTANIIPATNVYYEDSFAKFYGSDGNEQTGFSKTNEVPDQTPGVWYIDGQEKTATQALEALGEKTNHNVYGYDPAYNNCTMFSMGSARKVTVTNDMAKNGVVWPTAQFTFKGTGFDIISLTDNTSGAIFVDVTRKVNGEEVKERSVFVDNYYGYSYENGTWKAEPNNPNAIYQVPVIKVSGLDYDEHKVVIKVAYNTFFDDANAGSYSFWLDAVRVYDPAGNTLDNDYVKDREVKPIYVEVRKALIKQGSFTGGNENIAGAVFIDGKADGATIDDYKNFGPNHEVYLAGNQAIAFRIVANREPATVQIGVKLANGSNGTLKIGGGNEVKFAAYSNVNASDTLTLSTATDMYYALDGITWTEKNSSQESNVIVLTNTGDNSIVSITNVKCTYASITENTTNAVTLAISYDDALMAVDAVNSAITPVEPESEPEPEKTFEPERFEASWSRNVMQGRKATLTVKTSEDVEAITVDGQTIRSYRTRTERVGFGRRAKRITYREFTYSMVAQESADFSVTAINAEGTESEAITARLTVKTRPNSLRDMWDWFKGWF